MQWKNILKQFYYTQVNVCALHENVRICSLCIHSNLKWPHWDFSTGVVNIRIIIAPYTNTLNLALKHHKLNYLVSFLPYVVSFLLENR